MPLSRRSLLTTGISGLLASSLAGESRSLKVVIAGGHPGDPECGCAGTAARYTDLHHEVVMLYLNRGEGYCGSAKPEQCAGIRTAEAQNACAILKARASFADQVDGRAVLDNSHFETFGRILMAEKPDVVFTQWPIDSHRDHRAVSSLVLDAWLRAGKNFGLFYYEVAEDTFMFAPSDYVDISSVEKPRRAACFAHASQNPEKWYPLQTAITRARGKERGWQQAEAFRRHPESRPVLLP